jgi:hypothetical protein
MPKYLVTVHVVTQAELTEKEQEDLENAIYEMDLPSGLVEYVDLVDAAKL